MSYPSDRERCRLASACEELAGGDTRLLVAIADVSALVAKGSAIDAHARHTGSR